MSAVEATEPSVVTNRLFRVVLFSESLVRLMDRPGDRPSSWRLPHSDDPVQLVVVRDILTSDEVPLHVGFEYVVEVATADIEDAAQRAHQFAESTAVMLSAAGRSPVGRVRTRLAYEITPGVTQRDFRQWHSELPLPASKTPVPQEAFGALRTNVDDLANSSDPDAERLLWRLVLSLSWFRQAAHEDDAIFRFQKLWIAFEALEPVLRNHYRCERSSGYQGLRALAEETGTGSEEVGTGSEFVSSLLDLRRKLFHALRVTGDELRATAQPLLEPLEGSLARAWEVLLGIEPGTLPDRSVVPHQFTLKLFAVLHQADSSSWGENVHPYLELKAFDLKRVDTGDPREVRFTIQPITFTVRRAEAAHVTRMEIWGPSGITVEAADVEAIPDDHEAIGEPDEGEPGT